MTEAATRMGTSPAVTCIILNWNGWRDTVACLQALEDCDYPRLTTVVVDNGSSDDSVDRIRAAYPGVCLLRSETNLGFAGGNNIGIRHALAQDTEYLWLLNNDTQPAPDALSVLVAKATTDPRIGVTGSVCYYADAPERVQAWAGARANLWIGYVRNSTKPQSDQWFHSIYGASMLLSRSAVEEAGLLDEGFFLCWEETELCLRLRKRGWLLAAAPESRVLHKVNASTGGSSLVLDRYFTASGLRILRLHSPAPYFAMAMFLAMRFARRLVRFQFSRCGSIWAGVRDYRLMMPIAPRIR